MKKKRQAQDPAADANQSHVSCGGFQNTYDIHCRFEFLNGFRPQGHYITNESRAENRYLQPFWERIQERNGYYVLHLASYAWKTPEQKQTLFLLLTDRRPVDLSSLVEPREIQKGNFNKRALIQERACVLQIRVTKT